MKTFYFTILISIASSLFFTLNAQISKGTVKLSPLIDINRGTTEIDGFTGEFKTLDLEFGASLGVFLIDNLELGGQLLVLNEKLESGPNEQTSNGYAVGPYLRYYVMFEENLYMPISAGIAYNTLTSDDDFSEVTYSGIGTGFGVGLEYVYNNLVSIGCHLDYTIGSLEDDDSIVELDVTSTDFTVGFSLLF